MNRRENMDFDPYKEVIDGETTEFVLSGNDAKIAQREAVIASTALRSLSTGEPQHTPKHRAEPTHAEK